jgi:hypothetical protein
VAVIRGFRDLDVYVVAREQAKKDICLIENISSRGEIFIDTIRYAARRER